MAIGTKITLAGAKLLAKALGGKELKFTRGAFGDAIKNGSMKTPTQAECDALTALIHEKMSLPITSYEIVDDQIIVSLRVVNTNVAEDFRIAEIGLFAEDPDSHQEKLYGYAFQGNDGDKMHAANTDIQLEFQVELVTKICGAENVTAVITRIYNGLTQEDLDAHINSTAPHPNWDVVLTNTFNTHVNSTNPHPNWDVIKAGVGLSKSNNTLNVTAATDKKLGGIKVGKNLYMAGESLNAAAAELDAESRIKQLEINLANMYILLENNYGLGPKSNLQLVENYTPLSVTDTYSARVYSTASKNYLRIFEPDALRTGGYFTVTNGRLNQEQCKVESLAKWGDYDTPYIAHLVETLSRDYKGTNYLYRSTVTVRDNKAYGAGKIKTRTRKGIKTWKGKDSSGTSQVAFNAYPSLEASFELDGDWSLTSDGYFTLD